MEVQLVSRVSRHRREDHVHRRRLSRSASRTSAVVAHAQLRRHDFRRKPLRRRPRLHRENDLHSKKDTTSAVGEPVNLGIESFVYSDLRDVRRLRDLATAFDRHVARSDADLFARFATYREAVATGIERGGLDAPQESALLIDVSRCIGTFLTQLFRTDETPLRQRAARDGQVARFKKEFVAKRVAKVQQPSDVSDDAALDLVRTVTGGWDDDFEYALSIAANRLLDLEREFPRGA